MPHHMSCWENSCGKPCKSHHGTCRLLQVDDDQKKDGGPGIPWPEQRKPNNI
jgi:hypothetical protein